MPMPTLDPARFYAAVLADPSHKLPLPGPGAARFFSEDGAVVDSADAFYAHLLADGSLVRKPIEIEAPAASDKPSDAPKADADAPKVADPAPKPATSAPSVKAPTAS